MTHEANDHFLRRPSLAWQVARWAVASSASHAFLDRPWIDTLIDVCPRRFRRAITLRLLSLSPHYWVHQWDSQYGPEVDRQAVLEAEFDRNAESRKQICEQLLVPLLDREMTVLDFGCGPGFLAKEVSRHVRKVLATDVSRGVIACARQLNPSSNIIYLKNGLADLARIADASVDLVFSFAVFQHLEKDNVSAILAEFARVLTDDGVGIIHVVLKGDEYAPRGWWQSRVQLRLVCHSEAELYESLSAAGFVDIEVRSISESACIDDDIGSEQIVTFHRRSM